MPIQVGYSNTINTIIDGLVRNNKQKITGSLLTKGSISLSELENKEELEQRIRWTVEQTAYQVLTELKKQLGNELQIMEDGEEVMIDIQ